MIKLELDAWEVDVVMAALQASPMGTFNFGQVKMLLEKIHGQARACIDAEAKVEVQEAVDGEHEEAQLPSA